MSTNLISAAIEGYKEAKEEAHRERKARLLDYKTRLIENFNYSPREFYLLLAKAIERREVPGLEAELTSLIESVPGSSRRLYLSVARERFVYYVCAAPFGSGFFFSWRLVDERRPAKWYHLLAMLGFLFSLSIFVSYFGYSTIVQFLNAVGIDAEGIGQVAPNLPWIVFIFLFTAMWSLMRCAALPRFEWLAIMLEKSAVIGRVFERFFRPDTYYREDSKQMYQKAFDAAVNEAIDSVTTPQGIRAGVPITRPAERSVLGK